MSAIKITAKEKIELKDLRIIEADEEARVNSPIQRYEGESEPAYVARCCETKQMQARFHSLAKYAVRGFEEGWLKWGR